MKLNIPPLSQRDIRWKDQRLGTVNGVTIGSNGCVVTDMAMLCTYYGHPTLPNQLDDILTERGLYYDGDLFVNSSISTIFPDIHFDEPAFFCETIPAPIDQIKRYLSAHKPVVAALMNQGVRHYVLITGFDGDIIYCNDPWMGDCVAINDRWGDPKIKILQVNFFSGLIPATIPTMPDYFKTLLQENSLDLNNESQIREFFQHAKDYTGLKTDLASTQANITQIQSKLDDALAANRIQGDLIKQYNDDIVQLNKKIADLAAQNASNSAENVNLDQMSIAQLLGVVVKRFLAGLQ